MKLWLQQFWAQSGIAAALLSALAWFGLREVKRVDRHETRLLSLESDRVKRADIDELRSSLTASINGATDVIRADVRELRGQLMGERK